MKKVSFQELDLPDPLLSALAALDFTTPTPIQEQTIPLALTGRDILGTAQTGTGKTGAFMIPLLARIMKGEQKAALILAPTRELAGQIERFTRQLLGKQSAMRSVLLIGGAPMGPQLQQLRAKPQLIIGTPGRINDHLDRRSLQLKTVDCLVLDEMDRMLDMGFSPQLEAIARHLPPQRQTLMFSATFPKSILRLANEYLNEPERIAIGHVQKPGASIQQEAVHVEKANKYGTLLSELEKREGAVVIFVKTKRGTENLARKLVGSQHTADYLHGGLTQRRRDKVVRLFRGKKYRILIATDVAARGLDIPGIEHVINFDLPQSFDDYIHRIGRTGRYGATGQALSLVEPADVRQWKAIQHSLDPDKYPPATGRDKVPSGGGRRSFNNRRRRR